MDESTSQKTKVLTTGAPDSQSIETDLAYFLFHGVALGMKKITNETWFEVIGKYLYLLKPRLGYIDSLKTLQQMIEDGEWFGAPKQKSGEKVQMRMTFLPEGTAVNERTRGFYICPLTSSPTSGDQIKPDPPASLSLVLTEQGQWLEWSLAGAGLKFWSRFTEMSNTDLCRRLNANGLSGASIMDVLFLTVCNSRVQKERRLAPIRELEEIARQILSRARSCH